MLKPETAYPNWFAPYAEPMFAKHLSFLRGQPGLRFLQVGAFTGDASAWLLDNVLTGRLSCLFDVDTWAGSNEPQHETFDWSDVEITYDARVAGRTRKFKGTSETYFATRPEDGPFDFVYIDGDHSPYGVLTDGLASYQALRVGGLLAFDDYAWINPRTMTGPGVAVDALAACLKPRLRLIQLGAQAWFRKTA